MSQSEKKVKAKGPIRWEAVVPVTVIFVVAWAYFHFFFDFHLRKGLEFLGYQIIGAQVDIDRLETSFWKASLRIQGIQMTDAQKPERNMLEIDDVRFGVLWDGLLRARVVINEMAIEGIKVGTQRKRPGRVKPPEPPSDKPSLIEQEAEKIKERAVKSTEKKIENNVLGDIAAVLSGTSGEARLGEIEGTLGSKKKLDELDQAFKEKSKMWEERFKTLPKPQEIQKLGDRLKTIKTRDFKTPQEVSDSINQFQAVIKEADEKIKTVQSTATDLDGELKRFEQDMKALDAMVKKDIADLEARFRIPKLNPAAISSSLFKQYVQGHLAKFDKYLQMVVKYAPPNLTKKDSKEPDPQIQHRPRSQGISYEFGRPNSYPAFWIKKISVSSQAGATPAAGTVAGIIEDISSNQVLTGKPTVAKLKADFPTDGIRDFGLNLVLDNRQAESVVSFDMGISAYPVAERAIVQSPDVNLSFRKATGGFTSTGKLTGLRNIDLKFNNVFQSVVYDVRAENSTVQELLRGIFSGIPQVTVDASLSGQLPEFHLDIASNLGSEIQKGFEKQIQLKVAEAKKKIDDYVNAQIGAQKAKLEGEIKRFKAQLDHEIKKVQDMISGQKAQAEAKINESRKQAENQAKQQLQKEGRKAVEDLKKKFGF